MMIIIGRSRNGVFDKGALDQVIVELNWISLMSIFSKINQG